MTKTALITGVAGGMGYATAKELIHEGYHVVGFDISQPAFIPGLTFIKTDLTDPRSIDDAFQELHKRDMAFDCIIHMAGIYNLDSLVEISDEEFMNIFQTNLFSVYRINRLVLSLLKKKARIIITTSELAPLHPLPFTGIYAITKTALESYAFSLQMELQLLGFEVVILRPGAVNTGLLGKSVEALNTFCSKTELYPYHSGHFRDIVNLVEARNISPSRISDVVLKIIKAKHPKPVYSINRNPLLLLMNILPLRLQLFLIKKLLGNTKNTLGSV